MVNQEIGEANAPLDKVKEWAVTMGERGMYATNSARLCVTAIDQLASILGNDEPSDARYLLERLDDITARWARKHDAKPDTAAAYKSRSRRALQDFLEYQKDPASFRLRGPKVVNIDGSKKTTGKRGARTADATELPFSPPTPQPKTDAGFVDRSCPLSSGREFLFRLPVEGLTIRDVQRIGWHLATMATDFDAELDVQCNPLLRNVDKK